MNFYKHYLGDYARDTQSLSLVEHGAYRVLLDHCYATEKQLPPAPEVYRIAKAMTAAEKKAVDKVIGLFFPGGGNPRCVEEIANAKAYADAQAIRSNMRWHKQAQSPADASHSHSHSQTPEKPKAKEEGVRRPSRLQGDWALPKEWGEWALKEQTTWTEEHVRKVAENFRDHWIATPKGTKLDWFATWRKWVRGDPALKGNGAAVPVPKCARCGATDFASLRQTSEGRLCGACIDRADRVAA